MQLDLLFYENKIILHVIDECTRWTTAAALANRETATVLTALKTHWFMLYGAPQAIISDQEGALFSDEGAVWASRWRIGLKSKAKGQHAHIVERRNDLLRQQYNKVRSQATKDGLKVT